MIWGISVIINLYGCDKNIIRNKKEIKKFLKNLCKEINMKEEGSAKIKRFGKKSLKGYSAIQLIKTSSITIHFDEKYNRAFVDVFSCKRFNERKAEEFSKKFFKAKKSKIKILVRK